MRRQAQRFVHMRMQFADHTDKSIAGHHASGTARMPLRRNVLGLRLIQRKASANTIGNTVHGFNGIAPIHRTTFTQPTGVDGIAGQDARDMHRLIR